MIDSAIPLPLNELQSEVHLTSPSIEVRAVSADSQFCRRTNEHTAEDKRRKTMRTDQDAVEIKMMLCTIAMSLFLVAAAQGQADLPVYSGKFTLTDQVCWGKSVVGPGDYTITIQSSGTPTIGIVSKADGTMSFRVVSTIRGGPPRGVNGLLVEDKNGQLTVHSLSLADLRMVLIYDPSLARESVRKARVSRTVPVLWAKK
jgi:hypothetical protein